MKPRLGFVFSLLAACGIHAAVLLLPSSAGREGSRTPTIELTLAIGDAEVSAGVERAAPTARAAAIPAVQAAPIATPMAPAGERPVPASPAAPSSEALLAQDAAPSTVQVADATAPASEAAVVAASDGPPGGTAGPATPDGSSGGDSAVGPSGFGGATGAETGGSAGGGAVDPTTVGLTPPRPRTEIVPAYPRSARASGLQGTVKIAALIDESGALVNAEVLASSGHASLDRAALEAVRHARFAPAVLRGKAVFCRLIIPFRFQLN